MIGLTENPIREGFGDHSIRRMENLHWIGPGTRRDDTYQSPADSRDALVGVLTVDDLFLDSPLKKWKEIGCDPDAMQRPDSRYCWVVDCYKRRHFATRKEFHTDFGPHTLCATLRVPTILI